jgi:hypothetical protein
MADTGRKGFADIFSDSTEYNKLVFHVNKILINRNHCALVTVVKVTNKGELSPVGLVDVQPMVNMMDGNGNPIQHGIIHNLPYFRLQGGADAIILDPKVGDIGKATFSDRDISRVKRTRKLDNPGSKRQSNWADGLYDGGFLNGLPSQIVRFTDDGIYVLSPKAVFIDAPDIKTTGHLTHEGATDITSSTINISSTTINSAGTWNHSGSFSATTINGGSTPIAGDGAAAGAYLEGIA